MHQNFINVFYCNEVLSHELWSSKYENWGKSLWRGENPYGGGGALQIQVKYSIFFPLNGLKFKIVFTSLSS